MWAVKLVTTQTNRIHDTMAKAKAKKLRPSHHSLILPSHRSPGLSLHHMESYLAYGQGSTSLRQVYQEGYSILGVHHPTSWKPLDDVDEDALKEWLTKADGTVVPLKDKTMRLTFYHTPDALWRLEKFLKDLGLEAEDDDESIGDVEQKTPGRQVIIHVKHSPVR
mgnify:CR=1 FL=1